MPSNEFIAHRRGPSAHLREIGWERYYGTTTSGQLAQFKATSNPCGVDVGALNSQLVSDLNISDSSFRFYHIKCHYASESLVHEIVDKDTLSPTFGETLTIGAGDIASHTVTSGIMIKHNRGSKYGWICVDDNCPYYQNNGRRYFYY